MNPVLTPYPRNEETEWACLLHRRNFLKQGMAAIGASSFLAQPSTGTDSRSVQTGSVRAPGYIDCHMHVWNHDEHCPLATPNPVSGPEPATALPDDLLRVARAAEVNRIVLIQPGCYEFDNSYMLEAIRRDIRVARERDPARPTMLEVIFAYPGVHAVWGHRLSHWLWSRRSRVAARVVAELTRILTGVDIHPGAVLGGGLFIDHATGVVIGETAEIGDDVTLFHGVTLGGTGRDTGKRHPTVGDRVVIGAGAKVLGPIKIGDDSRIGANSVVVKEVPSSAVVVGVPGQIVSRSSRTKEDDSLLPDLVGVSLQSLLTRVARLEGQGPNGQGEPADRVIRPPEAGVWHGEDFSI